MDTADGEHLAVILKTVVAQIQSPQVFQRADFPGYAGLRLDPGEVKLIANPDVPERTSLAHSVVERLEIFRAVTKALLLTVSGNGTALVTVRIDAVEQGIVHLSEPAASEPGCGRHPPYR